MTRLREGRAQRLVREITGDPGASVKVGDGAVIVGGVALPITNTATARWSGYPVPVGVQAKTQSDALHALVGAVRELCTPNERSSKEAT